MTVLSLWSARFMVSDTSIKDVFTLAEEKTWKRDS